MDAYRRRERERSAACKNENADNRHISAGIESTSTRRQTLYSTCVRARVYVEPSYLCTYIHDTHTSVRTTLGTPPLFVPKAVSIDRSRERNSRDTL